MEWHGITDVSRSRVLEVTKSKIQYLMPWGSGVGFKRTRSVPNSTRSEITVKLRASSRFSGTS